MHKNWRRVLTLLLALVTVLSLLPVTAAQAAAMKQGSRGSEVKRLQQNLIGLGFLEGAADGSFGGKTKQAVQEFQAEYGLSTDGSAGEATQAAVRNAVIRLQVELQQRGYAPAAPTAASAARRGRPCRHSRRTPGWTPPAPPTGTPGRS